MPIKLSLYLNCAISCTAKLSCDRSGVIFKNYVSLTVSWKQDESIRSIGCKGGFANQFSSDRSVVQRGLRCVQNKGEPILVPPPLVRWRYCIARDFDNISKFQRAYLFLILENFLTRFESIWYFYVYLSIIFLR